MSKERARNRAAREQEAGLKAAARGAEAERKERRQAANAPKGSAGKAPSQGGRTPGKGRPTPKQSAPRTPAGKKRGRAPVGRPDGPLARRRRFRIRLLVGLLLVVNIAAGVVWRDWTVSLAVLIVSAITAPLLAAALLRRR